MRRWGRLWCHSIIVNKRRRRFWDWLCVWWHFVLRLRRRLCVRRWHMRGSRLRKFRGRCFCRQLHLLKRSRRSRCRRCRMEVCRATFIGIIALVVGHEVDGVIWQWLACHRAETGFCCPLTPNAPPIRDLLKMLSITKFKLFGALDTFTTKCVPLNFFCIALQ